MDEIKGIGTVKCSMLKTWKWLQILFGMIQHKTMWITIHQHQKFTALTDDGFSLAPGKNRCQKPCYLYVLLFFELVGNGDRIMWNKTRLVVLLNLYI